MIKPQNAKNVIISGSALNTPKVLELSGVGDPQVLGRSVPYVHGFNMFDAIVYLFLVSESTSW